MHTGSNNCATASMMGRDSQTGSAALELLLLLLLLLLLPLL
jgi:hypothetical protein